MIHEIPIFRQIRKDTSLSQRVLQVWCAAIEQLDVADLRPLHWVTLHNELALDRTTITRAVHRLVETGYLVADPEDPWRLRVPLSRVPQAARRLITTDAEPSTDEQVAPRRKRARRGTRVLSSGVV